MCFIGYLAAAWGVLDDDRWFWPVAIVFGSVSAQTHVTYLVPLSTVGVAMVVATVNRRASTAGRGGPGDGCDVARGHACLLVGPLADQFFGSGNLFALGARGSNTSRPAGWASGVRRLIDHS